eukprot:863565-Prymnesium_polylepis.1
MGCGRRVHAVPQDRGDASQALLAAAVVCQRVRDPHAPPEGNPVTLCGFRRQPSEARAKVVHDRQPRSARGVPRATKAVARQADVECGGRGHIRQEDIGLVRVCDDTCRLRPR